MSHMRLPFMPVTIRKEEHIMRLRRLKSLWITLVIILVSCFCPFPAYAATTKVIVSAGIADYVAIPMFETKHPEVKVAIESISTLYSELANKFIVQDSQIDLYRLNAKLGIFQQLRAKGYFLDLSSNEIIENFTKRMAEPFQDQLLLKNGKILGVPSFFILEYPILVNKNVADAIGLSEEEFPSNILELLKFVNSWEENYGEEFPEYSPFRADEASSYALAHRNPYIGFILEIYKDTLRAQKQPLQYNTSLFLELLGEIERWTYKNDQDYETKINNMPNYDQCLFYSFQAFDDEVLKLVCKGENCLNLPLTSTSPIVQAYELECAIVNPATKDKKLAIELAQCYIEDCQPALLRILCPTDSTPYQAPDYQQNLEELKKWRNDEEERLESLGPEKNAEQKELISFIDSLIQDAMDNPYEISEYAISRYKTEILPYLIPRCEGVYESEAIYAETMSYTFQWLDGMISAETYTKKLDNFLKIAIIEND